jgi:lysophospholipase L1-like esterase
MAMLLLFSLLNGGAAPLKITIASDSTAAYFPPTDYGKRTGWGQMLSSFFTANIMVDDLASSGRSSKSFYDEGKWTACLATHADYYFIQFGHNDGKTKDGVPVLLTPPTRRNYQSEHVLKLDSLQNYAQAMRELGTNMNVPVLDVLPASINFYNLVGKSGAAFYQANTATNTFENDATHFSAAGARQHCYFIVESLLHSTNASLVPLQKAIDLQAVRSQAALRSPVTGPK